MKTGNEIFHKFLIFSIIPLQKSVSSLEYGSIVQFITNKDNKQKRSRKMNPVSPLFEKIDSSIEKKIDLIKSSYLRYAVRAMMACLFLTLGTAIAFAIAMKGESMVHGLGKILYAFMFSWSLVMILYMNAELGTSNMLYMTVGVYRKRLSVPLALKILFTCVLFNLIGGVIFGSIVALTGPFQGLTADNFMLTSITAKLDKFWLKRCLPTLW